LSCWSLPSGSMEVLVMMILYAYDWQDTALS
jgi:hypothetical protein